MNEDLSHRVAILNFIPEEFRRWIRKAEAQDVQGYVWRNYALLLVAFAEAFSRAPLTEEACNGIDIVAHFTTEIHCLSASLDEIFPVKEEGHHVVPQEEK